jgi:hypothetical protein
LEDVYNILSRARSHILYHHKWTNEGYAVDDNGRQVDATDPTASKYSVEGAIIMSTSNLLHYQKAFNWLDLVAVVKTGMHLDCLERHGHHGMIMRLLEMVLQDLHQKIEAEKEMYSGGRKFKWGH